ncbi:XRE family transcriptional regulator [Priestia aryabhattai]|uniref:helix-turn-helix domain-containing protein n=1 Tax=Priestia aryabhattai TaxID=412384 RepID=UPI003D2792CB
MKEYKIKVNLDSILRERKVTQKELIEMLNEGLAEGESKFRPAALSEFVNNQRSAINKRLVERIATVLEIGDINTLLTFEASESPTSSEN